MKQVLFSMIIGLILFCLLFPGLTFGKIDPEYFSQFKPRSIGPAGMSGRISDIDVVVADPDIIYVGTATGGVWKSANGGFKWEPIFDTQSTSSIGAVVVYRENPNIVWVGTGEGNPRNSSGVGRGVFKSLDAGKTWTCMGLEKTEKIARMVIDPNNPDVVYVAALGTTWGENPERGIFKTTDGGKTWKKILYVDEKTGAADIAIAPDNPNKLIAAMWEHRRWPWFFKSGGPGSGLYITGDAGENWKKLSPKEGIPDGELGRCGIAFAPGRPNIVYAEVEAEKSALLRSEDGGFTWKSVNDKPSFHQRPFYYSDIRVNPRNENIVYSLQSPLWYSEDGGKTFGRLTRALLVHPDFQAMWLHPNGEYMIVGTDGGIATSRDRGKTWRYSANIPVGQFYHVGFDMDTPYNVYGGLQDNGSWRGPSRVLTDFSIYNFYWQMVGGGDGFDTQPDPEDNRYVYSMSQGGDLLFTDTKTGREKQIRPTETDIKHRYNWNAGFAQDPFETATIYYGSQFVHRSRDKGNSWEIISPDLTTNNPEKQKQADSGGLTKDVSTAENHTTILCIAPSPLKKGVIWVSTDDGNVQLTQDDGKTWQLVSKAIKGVPECTWAPHVEASKFNPAGAFVVFDDHRRANWTPYLFVTDDYGKTWKSLVTKDIDGFIHVIEQDVKNEYLLFIGTEFGLFYSLDRGKEWNKWTAGLPTAPVRDIAVHPRDNDLIIATHGRSIYILDDISFLRELTPDNMVKELYVCQPPDATDYKKYKISSFFATGDTEFTGQNAYTFATIYYVFNPPAPPAAKPAKTGKPANPAEAAKADKTADSAKTPDAPDKTAKNEKGEPAKPGPDPKARKKLEVQILDKDGKVVKKLKVMPKKGINRAVWDFSEDKINMDERYKEYDQFSFLFIYDAHVLPGTYTARFSYGDQEIKKEFQVKSDPRFTMDMNVLKKNQDLIHEMQGWFTSLVDSLKQISQTRKAIKTVKELLKDKDADIKNKEELTKKAEELDKKLKALFLKVDAEPGKEEQGFSDVSEMISYKLFGVYHAVSDSFEPLPQAAEVKYNKLKTAVFEFQKEYNALFETDVEAFKKLVTESGITMFKPFKPMSLK